MDLHPDFRDLLTAFGDAEVRYLLVGGYAVAFHSEPRYTKDVDLWIDDDPGNIERAVAALTAFGAPPPALSNLRAAREDEIVYMGAPPVRVDMFKRLPGVEFAPCYARREESEWAGVRVSVIGIADLIAAKRASGRPQDLLDIAKLEKAQDARGKTSE